MKKTIISLILAAGIGLAGCSYQPQPRQLNPSVNSFYYENYCQDTNLSYGTDIKRVEVKRINPKDPKKVDISDILDSL
jgi:hypothetical protein